MKKKGLTITLSVIGAVVALVLILLAVIILTGNQISIARCIVADNGSLYMVYDDSPVHLNYNKDTDYRTGDKLLIVHQSAFAESYPEQTRAYFIMKIGSGSEEDIPQKAFDVLIETGNYSVSNVGGADDPETVYGTVNVIEIISDKPESSYRVGVTLPATDFSSIGKELKDKFTQEWNTYDGMTTEQKLASSKLWGSVGIPTDTWSECEEAIGFDVDNPLESLEWLNETGYFGMESTDPFASITHVRAIAYAMNADRIINEVSITAGYNSGNVKITLTATISATTGSHTTGSVCNGYATYDQNTVNTGSGIPVLIVTTNEMNNTGYYNGDYYDPTAYWVKNNVFYALRVFGDEVDKVEIQAVLDRILAEI